MEQTTFHASVHHVQRWAQPEAINRPAPMAMNPPGIRGGMLCSQQPPNTRIEYLKYIDIYIYTTVTVLQVVDTLVASSASDFLVDKLT